ncbi:taurine ABC transporter ATP-binding protein [Aureimonas sp. AU40]|uniref:taurine ABC transporter ATP-binding protein n=1 Tax=Aureimonas sp. AU40 TaxID=1637747 RepID=UPI0007837138|nr:ABC transporter ATP-binding protein [Aureimonas sp. AU40]
MRQLSIESVSLRYAPEGPLILRDVSLTVGSGEVVVLVGRSGCGKTSLLNMAAGFQAPSAGRVLVDGAPVTKPGADRAVVFQDDALFPWMSVGENVAFALKLRGVPARGRRREAEALLQRMDLAGQADRRIWELSGGMRQRVGLARALAAKPDFLLMDEPLGALDAMTREAMQGLLLQASAGSGAGVLLVTHGIDEALVLGTRIVVLAPGPGRVARVLAVDFGARQLAGEPLRDIRRDPRFAAAREALADAIHERVAA